MSKDVKVPAVERALDVIEYLADCNSSKSLKEIGDQLKIPAASLFRLLKNLTARDYLVQVKENPPEYELGYKISQISSKYIRKFNLSDVAKPVMEELSERTNQTAQLGVLDGTKVIYIAQVLSRAPVNFIAHLYAPMAPNVCACAKCILAEEDPETQKWILESSMLKKNTEKTIMDIDTLIDELRLTKERGYGRDDEEFSVGIGCLAVPILGSDNECLGAIGVTGKAEDYEDAEQLEKIRFFVTDAAKKISKKIV
ncbi:transcriptional repressor IclR [Lachnospiraceae bacterium]|nr:transcriptional repressor IclR [Lachnospiraceae bacterium]